MTGARIAVNSYPAEKVPDISGWMSANDLRKRAVAAAGLTEGMFLKEKVGQGSEGAYYKFELLGADDRIYSVQLSAKNGMLLQYSVEEPAAEDADSENPRDVLPPEEAQRRALERVGAVTPDAVIFTKTKQTGAVYLVAFTLDDGTQYTIELNAHTGIINTCDVIRVSADTSGAIGMLKARTAALQKAGLTDEQVRFTKAKIDRSNAAYVYEMEFETNYFAYEVTLNMTTGELLRYRALSQ